MKVLELFAGTGSFSKVARERGHTAFTVDNDPSFNPDLCADIMTMNLSDIPFFPDIIWASPPCECFSTNTIGINWNLDRSPKREKAAKALELVRRTLGWIDIMHPRYFVVENPRAMLRKMPFMLNLPRKTVTYCQYGEDRMKPTDLWTNIPFDARCCTYGAPCHPRTPRGCYSGKSYAELAVVPRQLCEEVLIACEKGA